MEQSNSNQLTELADAMALQADILLNEGDAFTARDLAQRAEHLIELDELITYLNGLKNDPFSPVHA